MSNPAPLPCLNASRLKVPRSHLTTRTPACRWRPIFSTGLNRIAIHLAWLLFSGFASAAPPVVELEIRDHLFFPSEVIIPADTKVKLLVTNRDSTAEEFESYELNREKIIPGGRKAVIFIGPLAPGEYPFFGEFFPTTAQGKVIAQ